MSATINTPDVIAEPAYDEEKLRDACRALKFKTGISYAAQAREAGLKGGTFTNWLGGTYNSDAQWIAAKVSQWLDARNDRAQAVSKVRATPDFVETPTAQNIIAHLTYAHAAPDIAMVAGVPGVGKTHALEEYRRNNPGVFMITARESIRSTSAMLDELAFVTGVSERRLSRLNRAIGAALKGRKALIVVDEAQELTSEALNELRSFHDLWGCGIVFAGDMNLVKRIRGKSSDGGMAQLSSRIWVPLKLPRPRPADIVALADAWEISDPKALRLLQKIGGREGGLRELTKVLKLASLELASQGGAELDEAAIAKAYKQKELSMDGEGEMV